MRSYTLDTQGVLQTTEAGRGLGWIPAHGPQKDQPADTLILVS